MHPATRASRFSQRPSLLVPILLPALLLVPGWTTKAPGTLPRHLLRYPRHVKIQMSNYNRNRGARTPRKAIGETAEGF